MRKIRVNRLTEADLGDTSGEFDRLRAKLDAANIIGDGSMIAAIDTPDEFRDLIRLMAYETGVPNDQLGPYLSAVAQEFQKGQYDQPEEVAETIKITVGGLKAIIREELEKEDQDADDLVLVTIDAPADEEEAQKLAVKTVMDPNDQAESFFVSGGKIYFFASADDMKAWTAMTREDRADKPAPAASQEPGAPYMTREEFAKKLKDHEWYWQYSKGDRYDAGEQASAELRRAHQDFERRGDDPPSFPDLRRWSYKYIIEDMEQDEEGNLYRPGAPQNWAFRVDKEATISREDWNKIDSWFNK